jgi:hypothetical protein
MPESGLSGSVRGVPSNGHPYREPGPISAVDRPRSERPSRMESGSSMGAGRPLQNELFNTSPPRNPRTRLSRLASALRIRTGVVLPSWRNAAITAKPSMPPVSIRSSMMASQVLVQGQVEPFRPDDAQPGGMAGLHETIMDIAAGLHFIFNDEAPHSRHSF